MSREPSVAEVRLAVEPSFVRGGPERLFAIRGLDELRSVSCTVSMPAGPWLATHNSTGVEVGALGVLMDVTLGYLVNAAGASWSVSTEMSMDVAASTDTASGPLECTARILHQDASGALVAGIVTDGAGTELVHCTMRGRFLRPDVPGPEDESIVAAREYQEPDRTSLDSLLDPDVRRSPAGLRVQVSDRLTNPRGMLHGGFILTLVERAASVALPRPFRTAAVRVQLARGVPRGASLDVTPHVLHLGRSFGVVQVIVCDDAGRTCAIATVTRQTDPETKSETAATTPGFHPNAEAPYPPGGTR